MIDYQLQTLYSYIHLDGDYDSFNVKDDNDNNMIMLPNTKFVIADTCVTTDVDDNNFLLLLLPSQTSHKHSIVVLL